MTRRLRHENKIDEDFEIKLTRISLEEIIALKLELTNRMFKGKFFGFPMWQILPKLVKEVIFNYALTNAHSFAQVSDFFGMKPILVYKIFGRTKTWRKLKVENDEIYRIIKNKLKKEDDDS